MQTFIILIVSILFSIGTTAIIYMLLKNHIKKNTLCYLTSFIGFTLIVIFAFVQSECIYFETWSERTEIVEQDMKKLARLTDVMIKNLQKNFNYRLAIKYGLIYEDVKPVKFYFEQFD